MAYNCGKIENEKEKISYEFVREQYGLSAERFHVDPSHFTVQD